MVQNPLDRPTGGEGGGPPALTPAEKKKLELLTVEWEGWRKNAESQWREVLREKEAVMRRRLEQEAASQLASRADDLRRAHEEVRHV